MLSKNETTFCNLGGESSKDYHDKQSIYDGENPTEATKSSVIF